MYSVYIILFELQDSTVAIVKAKRVLYMSSYCHTFHHVPEILFTILTQLK